jgi:hypothetical protein
MSPQPIDVHLSQSHSEAPRKSWLQKVIEKILHVMLGLTVLISSSTQPPKPVATKLSDEKIVIREGMLRSGCARWVGSDHGAIVPPEPIVAIEFYACPSGMPCSPMHRAADMPPAVADAAAPAVAVQTR